MIIIATIVIYIFFIICVWLLSATEINKFKKSDNRSVITIIDQVEKFLTKFNSEKNSLEVDINLDNEEILFENGILLIPQEKAYSRNYIDLLKLYHQLESSVSNKKLLEKFVELLLKIYSIALIIIVIFIVIVEFTVSLELPPLVTQINQFIVSIDIWIISGFILIHFIHILLSLSSLGKLNNYIESDDYYEFDQKNLKSIHLYSTLLVEIELVFAGIIGLIKFLDPRPS